MISIHASAFFHNTRIDGLPLYMVLLYMPDYKNEPAGIEMLLPWSDFIKERCTGLIDIENITPENHEQLPQKTAGFSPREFDETL